MCQISAARLFVGHRDALLEIREWVWMWRGVVGSVVDVGQRVGRGWMADEGCWERRDCVVRLVFKVRLTPGAMRFGRGNVSGFGWSRKASEERAKGTWDEDQNPGSR